MSLKDLIINETDLDKELLEKIIRPYVRITRDSGKVHLTPKASDLRVKYRILVYLLGRKAAGALGMNITESSSPIEIENQMGIPGGSLRPNLLNLQEMGFVTKDSGRYQVPNFALKDIYYELFEREDDDIPF